MAYSLAAVVATVHEPLEVQRVPFPDVEPGGVLVKVEAATLCGTDVHVWEGVSALPDGTPYIPGHETCGTIVEIGGRRTDLLDQPLKVGDRIIATYRCCARTSFRTAGCALTRRPTSLEAALSTTTFRPAATSSGCRTKFRRRWQLRLPVPYARSCTVSRSWEGWAAMRLCWCRARGRWGCMPRQWPATGAPVRW